MESERDKQIETFRETGNLDDLVSTEPYDDDADIGGEGAQFGYVLSGYPGIMAAGCAYPFLISIIVAVFAAVVNFGFTFTQLEEAASAMLLFSFLGGAFGLFISIVTGLISIGLVCTMNWSLGFPLSARSASISAGSLAGYIPTAWILFTPDFGKEVAASAAIGFLGPLLAMTIGAYGASVASRHYSGIKSAALTQKRKQSLSISQMMIATTWIAVIFATANYFGGLGFAIAAAGWFGLQALMFGAILAWRRIR